MPKSSSLCLLLFGTACYTHTCNRYGHFLALEQWYYCPSPNDAILDRYRKGNTWFQTVRNTIMIHNSVKPYAYYMGGGRGILGGYGVSYVCTKATEIHIKCVLHNYSNYDKYGHSCTSLKRQSTWFRKLMSPYNYIWILKVKNYWNYECYYIIAILLGT